MQRVEEVVRATRTTSVRHTTRWTLEGVLLLVMVVVVDIAVVVVVVGIVVAAIVV